MLERYPYLQKYELKRDKNVFLFKIRNMKSLLLFVFLISLEICNAQDRLKEVPQDIPLEQLSTFVNEFLTAATQHDEKMVIKKLDHIYVKEQLKKFLKGNKKQFLDELFSGRDEKKDEYLTVPFHSITSIEVVEIIPNDETMTDYFFIVKTEKNEVKCQLFLRHHKIRGKYKLGFEGSFG